MKWNEMIGNIYGDLYVLRRATKEETPWKSHATPLWIRCIKCGHEWSARKDDIEKKKECPFCTVKTGRGHVNDLTGMQCGYLHVLKYDEEKSKIYRVAYWICQCECGNIISVRSSHLLGLGHARTVSCGCKTRSLGELITERTLSDLGFKVNIEIIVPECHKWSPFDIEVVEPNTNERLCFFECDGEQHFKTGRFNRTEEDLKRQQETDNIKNVWCENNNVLLFRIPYTDYDKINREYLISRFPKFKILLESFESRQN